MNTAQSKYLKASEAQIVSTCLILSGAFQFRSELQSVRLYQSTGGLHIFVMASEVIYFLFILYYMYVQVSLNLNTFLMCIEYNICESVQFFWNSSSV